MSFTIDTNSPERAWSPFMDWLTQQGIDPHHTRAVTITPETMTMTVTRMKQRHDKHYLENGDIAVEDLTVPISTLPPRRRTG